MKRAPNASKKEVEANLKSEGIAGGGTGGSNKMHGIRKQNEKSRGFGREGGRKRS